MKIVESFRNILRIPELRNRILFTLGMLIVFRFGSHITLPGINPDAIAGFQKEMEGSLQSLFHFMQIFSGAAFGNLALFGLGIMPYITASIIMQLMTKVSPALEAIAKEGPSGQRKIGQYTRYLAVPICIVQAWMAVSQLQGISSTAPIFTSTGFGMTLQMILGLTAGALFVMWLGEQITEYGLGNGASILIMAGIIARMPQIWYDLFDQSRKGDIGADKILLMAFLFLAAIAATVLITQAQRRIPIQHAKHFKGRRVMQGQRNYLPLRVNTAGVMPVIFASSLLVIPSILSLWGPLSFLGTVATPGSFTYMLFYVAMIFVFSYFWTYLFFQPHELANNLKEYGSFVPGIRPGENTAAYLNGILARITLAGAAFLCVIALLPDMVAQAVDLRKNFVAFLGGTGILIVVGVCLDIAQKIESHLLMHHYEGFVGGGGSIRGRRG
ncbi:MAG TPA: preprotein translocase subunit SecY [Planctomycetota bacterium]|nr:preprotein translocase subunit SecY [Planctomycetota bacterium]